ncbi:MAG: CinA family protein [Paracoccaceae bacterium]|nr:CinA family protein [Paracoccaceae bacterium]MDG1737009.1 CinA family protein [Paracoccaceae bacterium]MDG2259101.1 CinA family protein [Paracoccaceae bacterium]
MNELAEKLLELSLAKDVWIATAESCTAGLIAGEITSVAGSSAIFDRGFVTYTNAAKIEMLGVLPETLDEFGAVSEETAREMAEGALERSNANVTISVTGIAGPGGSDFKPEGRVCFGLATKSAKPIVRTVEFGAVGRNNVRRLTVEYALGMLIENL